MNLFAVMTILNAAIVLAVGVQIGFVIRAGIQAGLIRLPFAGGGPTEDRP
jgi:hypothetical protein